jgi:Immunoglobulin domain
MYVIDILVNTVPPQVVLFSPNVTQLDVREHTSLQLECQASGRPEPRIVWTKRQLVSHVTDVSNQFIIHYSRTALFKYWSYHCHVASRVIL